MKGSIALTRSAAGSSVDVRQKARHVSGARAAAAFHRHTRTVLLAGLVMCALISLVGLPYYTADLGERLRSPFHAFLKPSGIIGQSAGIAAFLLFAFLWLYPLRKRVRALAFTGALSRWLDVHIVAGLLVPLIGAVHAGWRFQGVIGLGYACMLTVSLSGIVGRYLYVHLPRSREGAELSLEEVGRRGEALIGRLIETTGEDPAELRDLFLKEARGSGDGHGVVGSLFGLLAGDFSRKRLLRRLKRRWGRRRGIDPATLALAVRLAERHASLVQQARMLRATQRLFRYWHVAHLPIAITGLAAVSVHVVVVVALGVTWFR